MKLKRLNLGKYKSYSAPVRTGEYNCTLVQERPSKDGGEKNLHLLWEVKDGEYAGRTILSWFNMEHERCQPVFAAMVRNMGFDPEKIEDTAELIGGECRLLVELIEEKNSPPRNMVRFYLPKTDKDGEWKQATRPSSADKQKGGQYADSPPWD